MDPLAAALALPAQDLRCSAGQVHSERGAILGRGGHGNSSAMPGDDFAGNEQAQAQAAGGALMRRGFFARDLHQGVENDLHRF